MNQLVFLPGASGSQGFWQPVLAHLKTGRPSTILAYPGFDGAPANLSIQNLHDLKEFLNEQVEQESILIAQSMGGVLALALALDHPQKVKGLVLLATSGGMNLQRFACADWRADYREQCKGVPAWFWQDQTEFRAGQLAGLDLPVLLIWGDHDPLSTVQLGQYLEKQFNNAELHVIEGGDHFFAVQQPARVAALIDAYLERI